MITEAVAATVTSIQKYTNMSKAIRWQLFFAEDKPDDQNPKHYRVDIYDEQDGSLSGITELQGGETPFVTDEDDSDDFFYPVRSQSGTLQVCTLLPGTTDQYITLDDLLPANNIARPVQLINLDTTPSPTIEWQGFLSCEAYSQDYTGIPQILDLPLISVLEAMDSVDVNPTTLSGMMYVFEIVYNTFHEIEQQSGMSLFDYVFYPKTDWRIFTKYIDTTAFFKQNEYNNENSTTYIVSGLSCKEVLEKIATYMGWIVREHKTWLYFQRVGEDLGMYRQSALDFVAAFHSPGYYISRPLVTKELATDPAVVWMGTGHQRTVAAGAKSVEVVAKLEKYDLNMQIPECPVGYLLESYYILNDIPQYLYELGNANIQAYSNCAFNYYAAYCVGSFLDWDRYWQTSFENVFTHMAAGIDSTARNYGGMPVRDYTFYAGAFLSKYCWENRGDIIAHETKNALHCVFFPKSYNRSEETYDLSNFDKTKVGPIFSVHNITNYHCNSGYLCLKADADTIFLDLQSSPKLQHTSSSEGNWIIIFELKFGERWWNGTAWQYTQCTFEATMTKNGFKSNWNSSMPIQETDGLLIPITSSIEGNITMKIWPLASKRNGGGGGSLPLALEMIFGSLSVEHILPDNDTLTDRGENHYFRLLGTNFRDEININTELASMLNNQPSPSLIMNTTTDPMKVLDYSTSAEDPSIVESRRPEVDMLNRLATYYSESRQRLELEMAHIESPALPLLKLQGISPDNRVYLPLSESRDWQTDVCKLTCFETPQEPAES